MNTELGTDQVRKDKMKHRHLNIQPNQWGAVVVESIWERGSDEGIRDLLRECKNDPFGPAVNAVRRAVTH